MRFGRLKKAGRAVAGTAGKISMQIWKKIFNQEQCVCHEKSKNLSEAQPQSKLRVECLCGEEAVCHRLRGMGFCERSIIEKLTDNGTLICKVCDTKVMLSKELAESIMVSPVCHKRGHERKAERTAGMALSQLSVGQRARIEQLNGEELDRLQEMGLTLNETVEVIRFAPLGDPIEIKVRGYLLSLRKQEADHIQVKLI